MDQVAKSGELPSLGELGHLGRQVGRGKMGHYALLGWMTEGDWEACYSVLFSFFWIHIYGKHYVCKNFQKIMNIQLNLLSWSGAIPVQRQHLHIHQNLKFFQDLRKTGLAAFENPLGHFLEPAWPVWLSDVWIVSILAVNIYLFIFLVKFVHQKILWWPKLLCQDNDKHTSCIYSISCCFKLKLNLLVRPPLILDGLCWLSWFHRNLLFHGSLFVHSLQFFFFCVR